MITFTVLGVRNLQWADADSTRINCEVSFADNPYHSPDEYVPHAVAEFDPHAGHVGEIFTRAVAGDFGPISAYVAPPPVVPDAITPLQARKALREAGLKAQVDAYVATLSEEEQEEWEYATLIERTHPVIVNGAAALGLTVEQIDQLFITAAAL